MSVFVLRRLGGGPMGVPNGRCLVRPLVAVQGCCNLRWASTRKQEKMRAFKLRQEQYRQANTQNSDVAQDAPDFASLLRQLYRKSHPDLLRHSHPTHAEANDASMQILNGILSTIKSPSYPPQMIKDVTFHLKTPGTTDLTAHVLQIRTHGGDCKKHLTDVFSVFFTQTGISEDGIFVWNKEYFPMEVSIEYADKKSM